MGRYFFLFAIFFSSTWSNVVISQSNGVIILDQYEMYGDLIGKGADTTVIEDVIMPYIAEYGMKDTTRIKRYMQALNNAVVDAEIDTARILYIGCGSFSPMANLYSDFYDDNVVFHCVDIDSLVVKRAQNLSNILGNSNNTFQCADARFLTGDFDDFDVVLITTLSPGLIRHTIDIHRNLSTNYGGAVIIPNDISLDIKTNITSGKFILETTINLYDSDVILPDSVWGNDTVEMDADEAIMMITKLKL